MYKRAFAIVFAAVSLLAMAARADIGAVGPNDPNPPERPSPAPMAAPVNPADAETKENRQPLLVVRFNQRHVYFDRMLKQAIGSAERARPGMIYEVISYLPAASNSTRDGQLNSDMYNRMNEVIAQMNALGVPPDRIRSSTQTSDSITAPEVRIFID